MKETLALFFSFLLVACNAYRATPESNVLYTRSDIVKKGFVLSPIFDIEPTSKVSVSELNAYDIILANTLRDYWKDANLLSRIELLPHVDAHDIEAWRTKLAQEEAIATSSRETASSTLTAGSIREILDSKQVRYPHQILIPSILQNTLSCGTKQSLPTYLHPRSGPTGSYCQRTLKMRFRIVGTKKGEIIWNGIVYATQETTTPAQGSAKEIVDPPTTQALVRECFVNFAKQFAD